MGQAGYLSTRPHTFRAINCQFSFFPTFAKKTEIVPLAGTRFPVKQIVALKVLCRHTTLGTFGLFNIESTLIQRHDVGSWMIKF